MRKLILGIFLLLFFSLAFADLVPTEPLGDYPPELFVDKMPLPPINPGPYVVLVFDVSNSMNWPIDVPVGYKNGQEYLKDLEEFDTIPLPTPRRDKERADSL